MFKYKNEKIPININGLELQLRKQLETLNNTLYSVLILDRTTDKATKLNKFGNTSLNKEDILNFRNVLLNKNKNGCDIYIKNEYGKFYNVVIDDLTKEKTKELLELINCDLIIKSSENNYQAIINIEKSLFNIEEINFITKYLNEAFGDLKFAGANHYFRLVSFNNKKAKNNNELVELVNFNNKKTKEETINLLKKFIEENKVLESKSNSTNKKASSVVKEEINNKAREEIAVELMNKELEFCKKRFKALDFSAVDFRIVKRLYKNGFNENEIAYLFLKYNDFEVRHANPGDYLNRTINKAVTEYLEQAEDKERAKQIRKQQRERVKDKKLEDKEEEVKDYNELVDSI